MGILVPAGVALAAWIVNQALKNERRLTRVETKLDSLGEQIGAILKHLGLNPGEKKEEEDKPSD